MKNLKKYTFVVLSTLLYLTLVGSVSAHTTLTGTMNVEVQDSTIKTTIILPEERSLDDPELFDTYVGESIVFVSGSTTCDHEVVDFDTGATTTIHIDHACVGQISELELTSDFLVFEGYEWVVFMSGRGESVQGVINENESMMQAVFSVSATTTSEEVVENKSSLLSNLQIFTWQGMKHIYIGIDHILFVLVLVLLAQTLRQLLIYVTAFTVAHSITLILAKFNLVTVSPSLVEPIIALSIAYMALEQEVRRAMGKVLKKEFLQNTISHWKVIFGFGLFHGLGFASVFSDLSIPEEFFISSLLSFNVGVEIGQLTIVLVAYPVVWLLRYKVPTFPYKHWVERAALWAMGIIALWWFVERILS